MGVYSDLHLITMYVLVLLFVTMVANISFWGSASAAHMIGCTMIALKANDG